MSRPELDLSTLESDRRVVWTEDVLRFRDTDANGHVNNSVFSVFCESGRVHYLHDILDTRRIPGIFFVVARLAVDFRGELYYPGRVRCGTWLPAIGRSSLTFMQGLFDGSGRLVGNSQATVVHMDLATRRPTPIDETLRARIEPMLRA